MARRNTGLIYTFDPYDHRPWQECVRRMYQDGVRTFSYLLPLPLAWREDGSFDFSLLDELEEELVALAPDAVFLPRIFMTAPYWWSERYPEELMQFTGTVPRIPRFPNENQKLWKYETKMYHAVDNASMASEVWWRDAGRALHAYLEHTSERRFPLVGAMPVYGTCGEWGQFGSYCEGFFGNDDSSAPMTKKFRHFLSRRYGSDDALRKAWRDPQVTLKTAEVPSKLERMATEKGAFRSPAFYRKSLDYFAAFSEVKAEAINGFCAIVKAINPNLLTGTFGGAMMQVGSSAYTLHAGENQGILKQLLEKAPHLDFLSTPNVYFSRMKGIFSQAAAETIARRKRFIAECDVRTALDHGIYAPTAEQSRNQFAMELGYNLCNGSGEAWLYDFGHGWYAEEEIRSLIRTTVENWNKIPRGSIGKEQRRDIAFVVSPESLSLSEGTVGFYRMANEMLYSALPRSGCCFNIMTIDELMHLPPHKLYVFRDLFFIHDNKIKELRAFLERHHASAVWLGGAGCITPDCVDFDRSRQLTTFRLQHVPELTAPVSLTLTNADDPLLTGRKLPQALAKVEKFDILMSPVLFATEVQKEQTLGLIESLDLPGLVIRRDPERKRLDVWSATAQLDAQLIRNLAEESGISPIISSNVPVSCYGSRALFVIRFDQAGTGRMPFPVKDVWTEREYLDGIFAGETGECFLMHQVYKKPPF
ncbi:MAG: hypothetical protein GX946_10220 [Oligosphaeraceae bacterium]|nr:hypothetical protein [Oligosphaeraceae bacterium]